MQMIGQHDEGVDRERVGTAGGGDRLAQGRDMVDEQRLPALQQIDGEEPAPARDERATIVGHGGRVSCPWWLQKAADYACG